MRERNILNELNKIQNHKEKILEIIINYFFALKKTMNRFSEFGNHYSDEFQNTNSDFWNNEIRYIYIKKYNGKGKLKIEEANEVDGEEIEETEENKENSKNKELEQKKDNKKQDKIKENEEKYNIDKEKNEKKENEENKEKKENEEEKEIKK